MVPRHKWKSRSDPSSLCFGENAVVEGDALQGGAAEQAVSVSASCHLSTDSSNGIWLCEGGSQECA